jgi:hypothetical protein
VSDGVRASAFACIEPPCATRWNWPGRVWEGIHEGW